MVTNEAAKDLTRRVFDEIAEAKTVSALNHIFESDQRLKKSKLNRTRYPELGVDLIQSDINWLRRRKLISNEGRLVAECSRLKLSPLEKLLYSIIWKNGDLGKEVHIVAGVESLASGVDESPRKTGLVFFQFGKHLANRMEPIIDQHVLRAFALKASLSENDAKIIEIRSKSNVNPTRIREYKDWLRGKQISLSLKRVPNYVYYIDQILFALGKTITWKK